MGAKWFVCPDGQRCEIEQCLKPQGCRMGSRCTTWSFLSLAGAQRTWNGVPSVTQLIKGTCQAYLELTTDYAIEPDDSAFRIIGTKAHDKLAKQHPDIFVEERLTVDGISGQFDEYTVEDGVAILSDYKTSGSFSVAKCLGVDYKLVATGEVYKVKTKDNKPGDPKMGKQWFVDPSKRDAFEYDMQLNQYRIMMESIGYPVDKMRLVFIVRDGGTRIATDRGILRKTYLAEVPKIADETVTGYFQKKRAALLMALEAKAMPPKCSDRETWDGVRCEKFCPVKEKCPHVQK